MAKLSLANQLPYKLIKQLEKLEKNSETMMKEMTHSGAEVVYQKVVKNMKKAFKNSKEIVSNLKITKDYKTRRDMAINTKVAVYGYIKTNKKYSIKNNYKNKNGTSYTYQGLPTDFVVKNREFGNSRGEAKKPIFRNAFGKNDIEKAMLKVQEEYLPKE